MTINFILRLATLALLIIWRIYWFIHTKEAALKKPKTDNTPRIVEQIYNLLATAYVIINLLGFVIFPFKNILIQILGFILVILGFAEGVSARKILDSNWTESFEYQIKKKHKLITKGIYQYVRHPIYGGLILMPTGALLVSGSFTFIAGLIIMLFATEIFAKREEKLLTKHFGRKYIEYKKTTKKFIPFIY
ncbi:isoprenylcysteine carboxylmethyltransferase family protein [Candidatus Roizmanbacteria bacterium]|nr:isoprenylcysteine carboxylmethyltransferase family protein [Candidatus Roizmanbacteria bacterium]